MTGFGLAGGWGEEEGEEVQVQEKEQEEEEGQAPLFSCSLKVRGYFEVKYVSDSCNIPKLHVFCNIWFASMRI